MALVQNFVISWRHLHCFPSWPPDCITCIATKWRHLLSWKFGKQMAQLGLVQNLVIWWHHLHCLQSWPPGCVTCIATLPWIALLALSVGIELVSSLARVTSVKFQQGVAVSDWHPDPKIGTQVYLIKITGLLGNFFLNVSSQSQNFCLPKTPFVSPLNHLKIALKFP